MDEECVGISLLELLLLRFLFWSVFGYHRLFFAGRITTTGEFCWTPFQLLLLCLIEDSQSFALQIDIPRSLALPRHGIYSSTVRSSQTRGHNYNYNYNYLSATQPNRPKMHFLTTTSTLLLLLATASLHALAAPLTFTDIERRWSAGESDVRLPPLHPLPLNQQPPITPQTNQTKPTKLKHTPQASIHATHNPRSASPAWPIAARDSSPEPSLTFAESYDAVTQQGLIGKRSNSNSKRNNNDSSNTALMARTRDYATRLLRSKGETQMIEERSRSGSEEVAPVLRPRKVVYRFSS